MLRVESWTERKAHAANEELHRRRNSNYGLFELSPTRDLTTKTFTCCGQRGVTQLFGTQQKRLRERASDLIVPRIAREAVQNQDALIRGKELNWRPFGNGKTVFALTFPLWQRHFAWLRADKRSFSFIEFSGAKKAERKLRRSEQTS